MAKYKATAKGQGLFLAVDLEKQLIPGTFEWAMSQIVDHEIDLKQFDGYYKNDATGASAIEPRILLKIIFYGYRKGQLSSRKMMDLCIENMTMKSLAEDVVPDFTTIAAFIREKGGRIEKIFTEVLLICDGLKLIGGKTFAIDGCKLPSNASKEWSGTHEELKEKAEKFEKLAKRLVSKQKETDKEESRSKKKGKSAKNESERLKARIKKLRAKAEKIKEFLESNEKKPGADGEEIQSNVTDNQSAKIKSSHGVIQGYNGIAIADGKNQVIVAGEAFGTGPETEVFEPVLNHAIANMKELTGKEEPLENSLVLGDTGYFSENNLQAAKAKGVEVLIPDQQFRKRDERFAGREDHYNGKGRLDKTQFTFHKESNTYTCPCGKDLVYKGRVKLNRNSGEKYQARSSDCKNCRLRGKCIASRGGTKNPCRTLFVADKKQDENLCQKMKDKIDKPENRDKYSQRMQIIEPVFANIRYCKGMNRFTLRGKRKVNYQWLLFCIVHNIGKCTTAYWLKYEKKYAK
jgi:transposase